MEEEKKAFTFNLLRVLVFFFLYGLQTVACVLDFSQPPQESQGVFLYIHLEVKITVHYVQLSHIFTVVTASV